MYAKDALISPCQRYRYWLSRSWKPGPAVLWVMLNPSTADHMKDDPTILRVVSFSRAWGYSECFVVNLFPYRATDPAELYKAGDAIYGESEISNTHIIRTLDRKCQGTIVAWGAHPLAENEGKFILGHLHSAMCLGKNNNGSPKHPLYVPASTKLLPYLDT